MKKLSGKAVATRVGGAFRTMSRKKKIMCVGALLLVVAIVVGTVAVSSKEVETEVVSKETTVKYGTIVSGVTESGTVDIGTLTQTFDLDMSALVRTGTSSDSSSSSSGSGPFGGGGGAMGGLDSMFGSIFNMGGNSNTNSGDAMTLTVAEVAVSVGQQVSEGDALYVLEEDSVSALETELEDNVSKASADLEAVKADQTLSKQQAEYTLESSTAYGSFASTEYNTTVQELQDAVDSAQKTLAQAEENLADYQAQLEELQTAYEKAAEVLANCEYSRDHADVSSSTYAYVTASHEAQSAETTANSLKQQKEQMEKNVEQARENVTMAQSNYNKAVRELARGKLSAKETKSLRELAYNTAQETYDIAIAYLNQTLSDQEETYNETMEKWEEFSTYIDGNTVRARYNGVITEVSLEAGDTISTGTSLVTLYDMDEVSITVTVDEDDMTDIAMGSTANVALTAYPDETFTATVTQIGEAAADSSGNVTYDITVTLQGDVSGLFQGMTGDVTFVSEQHTDVFYVSRRAIITENDKSYVLVLREDGSTELVEVTTGLSDGSNVEIAGDVTEGDTVLIESGVK